MTRELNAWINRLNTRLTNVTNRGNIVLLIKYVHVAVNVHISWLGSEFWPTWCMVSKVIIPGYLCSHGSEGFSLRFVDIQIKLIMFVGSFLSAICLCI